MTPALHTVSSTLDGFQELIRFHHEVRTVSGQTLDIDMSSVVWLDANMCAPLGAILYSHCQTRPTVRLMGMRAHIEDILQKNGFLPNFGFDRARKPDSYQTTIEYQRFERRSARAFRDYVARHFVGKGLPEMSQALQSKFRESISELLENAVDHSETRLGIFACGQRFPKKSRLDFSVADLGIGMRANVSKHTGLDLTPEAAIAWAMEGTNTTRSPDGRTPGGLGLKLIRDFISLNGGSIQIVSDEGYWSFHRGQVESRRLRGAFPGTVVNIEVNTADQQSYVLTSEIDPDSIF